MKTINEPGRAIHLPHPAPLCGKATLCGVATCCCGLENTAQPATCAECLAIVRYCQQLPALPILSR